MQFLFDRGLWKQLLHPLQRAPVRSGSLAIEKTRPTEQQGTRTNRSQKFHLPGPFGNPSQESLVIHFPSCPPTTWDDQNVQFRAAVEIEIRQNPHTSSRHDRLVSFCHENYVERRRLLTPFLFVQPRRRKNLK